MPIGLLILLIAWQTVQVTPAEAVRSGLHGLAAEEIPRARDVLRRGWYYFLPLVAVIGLLFHGYSPDLCAFWGIVTAFALSWLKRETRMGPKKFFRAIVAGAHNNTSAGAAIGSLGVIIGGIVLSGLGLKFSAILIELSGGYLITTVALVTLISIIIGMGSSTTGSYIILSVVAAPALIHLGVPEVPAHLVVFYAACLSNITPPVCVSAFAGASIAGADPMKTGFAALKFGATLALVPFSFVYMPELLLHKMDNMWFLQSYYSLGLVGRAVTWSVTSRSPLACRSASSSAASLQRGAVGLSCSPLPGCCSRCFPVLKLPVLRCSRCPG